MTINNFNSNTQPQNQTLDIRTNIINQGESLDLWVNRDLYVKEQESMDTSEPSISMDSSISRLVTTVPLQSMFQVNFRASTSRSSPSKKIINAATTDFHGNIIALNFSKIFVSYPTLRESIFEHLDVVLEQPDIYKTVKKIILKDNKLRQLPENILNFTNLKSIDLSNNRFSIIPFQIYNLKKLKKLFLKNNFINYLPIQIGRLKHLEELHLYGNKITKIHKSLFSLKKLHTLNLSQNRLSDIPKSIQRLRNLETLNVSFNNLFTIPAEIFGRNLEYLDLSDNHIDTIPNAIKNSYGLRDINFDNNEIVNIPDEIGDLPHVTAVCLNDNPTLRGFSDNLYKLLSSCIVEIDRSGLSLSTLSEIKARSVAIDYNGPTFEFSIEAAEKRMEERLAESLYAHTNRPLPRSFNNLRSISDQLEMWLNRLDWMSDFQHLRRNPALPESIIDCLEYAEANAEYRQLFKDIIEGATATCGDGITLSIIDIGIARQILAFMESNQIVELSQFLLNTVFPRQILQKIADQKITLLKLQSKLNIITNNLIDDVEIYLAYPVLLKEHLSLAIDINSMVTEMDKTGVTQEDLKIAALEVEKQRTDEQACAEFLINNTYWTELLKRLHPKEYEAINEQSIEMMEESDEAAQVYRRNNLIALSGITLKHIKAISFSER